MSTLLLFLFCNYFNRAVLCTFLFHAGAAGARIQHCLRKPLPCTHAGTVRLQTLHMDSLWRDVACGKPDQLCLLPLLFDFCVCFSSPQLKVPLKEDGKEGGQVSFRKLLLTRCQKEFEKDKSEEWREELAEKVKLAKTVSFFFVVFCKDDTVDR